MAHDMPKPAAARWSPASAIPFPVVTRAERHPPPDEKLPGTVTNSMGLSR